MLDYIAIRRMLSVASVIAVPACAASPFAADLDAGGCQLERVAVEEGTTSFHSGGLSPDGRTLAVGWNREDGSLGSYLLDLRTGDRSLLPTLNHSATFAPDGSTLISATFIESGTTDLIEHNLRSGASRVIAEHEQWDWLPSYSPDGALLAFNSYRTGNSDIYLYEFATEELRRLTTSDAYEAHAQFSPDGRSLVFHRQLSETDFNLYLLDIETGAETQLTDAPGEESYPSWAPDGRHLFFSSDRDAEAGRGDVFVMTLDGAILHRLTTDPANDTYAFVSSDGRRLYFNSDRDPQGIYRMPLADSFDCLR